MEKVKLGDVCTKASSAIRQKDLEEHDGEYAIYGASGFIKNVDFYQQDKEYIAVVKDGAGVGRVMKLPAYSSVIGTLQYILPKAGADINYLCYAMEYMNLSKYYMGAAIPHIYFRDYQNETLLFPPLEEQRRIADILDQVSALLDLRRQQLEKLDQLVKSQFIEMFGDPIFNPRHYPEIELRDLGDLARGVSKSRPRNKPELLGGPYPLVQTGEVSAAELYINSYTSTYSEEGLAQSKMWPKGTLCITIAANIAQTGILTFDACFPDSVVGFISGDKVNQIYIHFWFSFFQKILEEQAPQVAQKNINLKILGDLKVMVPPVILQQRFTEFVQQADKSKLEIKKSLEQLETLKKALMQKYFG